MLYAIKYGRNVVHVQAGTIQNAIAFVRAQWAVIDLEIDADNPTCADFFTAQGMVGTIQPADYIYTAPRVGA